MLDGRWNGDDDSCGVLFLQRKESSMVENGFSWDNGEQVACVAMLSVN